VTERGRKPVSAVTRVNRQLAAQGREERLVRGRGYYYLMGGESSGFPATAIYSYRIEPEDYERTASTVRDLFAAAGIAVTFEPG